MNKLPLLASLSVFFILGTGCQIQTQDQITSLPPAVEELQTQTVPESQKVEKPQTQTASESKTTPKAEPAQIEVTLYRGSWFDIEYPQNFTAKPNAPTTEYKGNTYVQTDEAYFISPDGTVEFFIYSPLWRGDPKNYLIIAPTEELVSEKIEEKKENELTDQYGDKVVRWVTLKAKDSSYYRSFISIKEQVGTGSDLHYVFGIKYQDSAAYEKHKDAYVAFKESLRQYAD